MPQSLESAREFGRTVGKGQIFLYDPLAALPTYLAQVYAREAILWGQLCHPNVLPFYGLRSLSCSQIAFVAPWAENGNLSKYLLRKPMANRILLVSNFGVYAVIQLSY